MSPGPLHMPEADSMSPARPIPRRVTTLLFESKIWLPTTCNAGAVWPCALKLNSAVNEEAVNIMHSMIANFDQVLIIQ